MSKQTDLSWLLLPIAVLAVSHQVMTNPGYRGNCTRSEDGNGGLELCVVNDQDGGRCPCRDATGTEKTNITQTCAGQFVNCQSNNSKDWFCDICVEDQNKITQDYKNSYTCSFSLPSAMTPATQKALDVVLCDVTQPASCNVTIYIDNPPYFLNNSFSQEVTNASTLVLKWKHEGHAGQIEAYLHKGDIALLKHTNYFSQDAGHYTNCTIQCNKTKDNVKCTWTSLPLFVNFTSVVVRWKPINSSNNYTAYNITLLSGMMLVPEIVKNVTYSNITSVSVRLTVWETENQEIRNYSVAYYFIQSSNNEAFGCVVFRKKVNRLCYESEKLKDCKQTVAMSPETSVQGSAESNIPVSTSSADRNIPIDISLYNLWPSTLYNFTLTPVFCNGSHSVDGTGFPFGPVETSRAEIKSVNFTSKSHDNLTVKWTTFDPHPNVTYTVYVTDALSGKVNDTCTEHADESSKENILCFFDTGDTKATEYKCTGNVSWPFWEYRVTVNGSSVRANLSYQAVVHTEPRRPSSVASPNVTTANNSLNCGNQRFTNYSLVCVTWYDMCPRDRNGFVTQYLVKVKAAGGWSNNETFSSSFSDIKNMSEYRLSRSKNNVHLVRAQPGDLNITISALTNDSVEGESVSRSVGVIVPKPALALNQSQVEELVKKEDVNKTMTSLQFTLPSTTFMFSDSNGFTLNDPIFIITRQNEELPENDTGVKTFDKYPSWHQRNNTSSLAKGYRVHLDVAESNTSTQLEIGSNQTCANISDNGSYCNGPLEPGQNYSVSSALCNEMLCVFVTLVKDVSTLPQAKVAEDSLWMKLLVGGGAVVAALVVILIIYLCCCCRRRQRKELKVSDWTQMKNIKGPQARRPMKLAALENVIATKQRDDGLVLRDEYCDLSLCTKDKLPHVACDSELNRSKNRWADIVTYDHSRVKLSLDEEGSDYINANFIPGYSREKEYIATQGPLPFTTNDFWKMVWEYQVSVIVMLTLPKEEGKIKCEHYWPAQINETVEYGDIGVTTVSVSNINDYNITIFTLQHVKEKGKKLRVSHFQYLKWPDMTADVTAESMVEFITVVRQQVRAKSSSPVVVHCSAGVGRSGTFICLDYALQFINEQPITAELDLFRFILRMRQARILMVQTESQYILIHQCASYMMAHRRRREAERISSNSSRACTLEGATGIDMTMTIDEWQNDENEQANQDTEELDNSQLSEAVEELDTSQLSHAESSDQIIERRPVFKNHREKNFETWHLRDRSLPPQLHVSPTDSDECPSSP